MQIYVHQSKFILVSHPRYIFLVIFKEHFLVSSNFYYNRMRIVNNIRIKSLTQNDSAKYFFRQNRYLSPQSFYVYRHKKNLLRHHFTFTDNIFHFSVRGKICHQFITTSSFLTRICLLCLLTSSIVIFHSIWNSFCTKKTLCGLVGPLKREKGFFIESLHSHLFYFFTLFVVVPDYISDFIFVRCDVILKQAKSSLSLEYRCIFLLQEHFEYVFFSF